MGVSVTVKKELQKTLDQILDNTVNWLGGVPGVVAMVTDRNGNIYEGAAGVRDLNTKTPMSLDTVFALFSTTKAITGAVLMKLVEEGKVDLHNPAKEYVPEIADIMVLEGFDDNGNPILRKPKTDITVNMLMLHTAGFGYEFFSEDEQKYRDYAKVPPTLASSKETLKSVLLFEPGTRWNYGINIDWIGQIIEAVTGKRLGEVMAKTIFNPLGIKDIAFTLTPSMLERRATIHTRSDDGALTPNPDIIVPQPPPMDMGGGGLYGSIGEYMKFIRMILNDGAGVLSPETVAQMATNGLGDLKSGGWKTSDPSVSNSGEFFPGVEKSWSYTFQVNDEPLPTGRPAGQLMWAGLANTYYWIDRETGIGGYWATQLFPFHDPSSYLGFLEFESAVYNILNK